MENIRQQFGLNLRGLRNRAGLSQEELGERCELDRTEISLLERGLRFPRLDTVVKLARALELESPGDLLDEIHGRSFGVYSACRPRCRHIAEQASSAAIQSPAWDETVGRDIHPRRYSPHDRCIAMVIHHL
jgi:transcriptional regulator with XRE-family HTH domain